MIIGIRKEKVRGCRATMQQALDVLLSNYGIEHAVLFELGVSDGYAWKCKSGEWGTITFLDPKGRLHMKVKNVVKRKVLMREAKYTKKGKLKKEAKYRYVKEKVKSKVWAVRVTSNNEERSKI